MRDLRPARSQTRPVSVLSLGVALLAVLFAAPAATAQCEPELLGSFSGSSWVTQLSSEHALRGATGYVVYEEGGLITLDCSDPDALRQLDAVAAPFTLETLRVAGGNAYLVGDESIALVDVADPEHMELAATLSPAGFHGGLRPPVARGQRLYVPTSFGLRIYDCGDPAAPALVGTISTHETVRVHAADSNGVIIIEGIINEFEISRQVIVDTSDPAEPVFLASNSLPQGEAFWLFDGYALVSDFIGEHLRTDLYDISDPVSPVLVSTVSPYFHHDISASSGTASIWKTGNRIYISGRAWAYDDDLDSYLVYSTVILELEDDELTHFGTAYNWPAGTSGYSGELGLGRDFNSSVAIVDMSDPPARIYRGRYSAPSIFDRVATGASVAVFASKRDAYLRREVLSETGERTMAAASRTGLWIYEMTMAERRDDLIYAIGFVAAADGTYDKVHALINWPVGAEPQLEIIETVETGHFSLPDLINIRDRTHTSGDLLIIRHTIFDIFDPASPVAVGTLPDLGGVADLDGSLVCFSNSTSFRLVDIADPSDPVLLVDFEFPRLDDRSPRLYSIAIQDGFLYARVRYYFSGGSLQVLEIYNIADPTAPVLVGSVEARGENGMAVEGDLVVINHSDRFLYSYDVSDRSNPYQLGRTTIDFAAVALRHGVAALAAGADGFALFDMFSPVELAVAGSALTAGTTFGVTTAGDLAFVSAYDGGLRIFDVSSTTDIAEIGSYEVPDRAYQTAVVGDLAYVAAGISGLLILDVSDPSAPALIGSFQTSDVTRAVQIHGDLAYLATRFDGLQIIDVSDPSSPQFVGSVDTPGNAQSVAVDGDIVYVADGSGGMHIIDTTNRSMPTIVGSYDTPQPAREVMVRGSVAFVATGGTGLLALDVSGPSDPQLIGTVDGMSDARGVAAWGHLAFVADFNGRVHMVDIADPAEMRVLRSVDTFGTGRAIAADGRTLYLADGDAGLTVLEAQPCWYRPCPADLNDDGLLDFFDVQAFLNAYSDEDGLADWNDDGAIDFFDLLRYVADLTDGCG